MAEFDIHPRGNRPHGAKAKQQPTPPYTHTLNQLRRVSIWNFPSGVCEHQKTTNIRKVRRQKTSYFRFVCVLSEIIFSLLRMRVWKRGENSIVATTTGRLYYIFCGAFLSAPAEDNHAAFRRNPWADNGAAYTL